MPFGSELFSGEQSIRCSACAALVGLLVVAVLATGCEESGSSAGYEQTVMQERVQRDMQMREKNSVLAPKYRDTFKGLDYFAVDSTYRYEVPLRTRPSPDTVMLAESTGRIREQVRLGRVTVPLPSGDAQLAVFKGEGDDPRGRLWIPFADATNGDATYKAGRYVDLRRTDGDSVAIDFNRAYNPTCVYNPEYACPLPPEENEIGAPIPVGEKTPKFARSSSSE
jgi:uncharacterized protein (DUF1684 family)